MLPHSRTGAMDLSLGLSIVELKLATRNPLVFTPHETANRIRGMWGKSLYGGPVYERLFAPSRRTDGPSGLKDPPRPYVLRTRSLEGKRFAAGEEIPFRVHVFDRDLVPPATEELRLSLSPPDFPVNRVQIEFLTPTELKGGDGLEFGVLLARLRDRVSSLRALYGEGPLELDYVGMGERARRVRTLQQEMVFEQRERTSHRSGQTHGIGGFVGRAVYEGDLGEFLPYLEAGAWTGVGRQTVWGKGEIRTTVLA